MDNFADERDYKLLENDKYTFFVLRRIIDNPCELLLSDHEKLILCYSGNPYPVWIWTPDDSSAEEMDRAYSLAQENGLFDGKRNFIVKYQLAERFMETASHEGRSIAITKNMFAYGDMIEGMVGTFVNYSYTDAFNTKYKQLRLPGYSKVFEITEVA